MNNLDDTTRAKIAHAGELVIRAAAVLGTLSEQQQREMRTATEGALPDSLGTFLRSARAIAPELERSLRTHPPAGVCDFQF